MLLGATPSGVVLELSDEQKKAVVAEVQAYAADWVLTSHLAVAEEEGNLVLTVETATKFLQAPAATQQNLNAALVGKSVTCRSPHARPWPFALTAFRADRPLTDCDVRCGSVRRRGPIRDAEVAGGAAHGCPVQPEGRRQRENNRLERLVRSSAA